MFIQRQLKLKHKIVNLAITLFTLEFIIFPHYSLAASTETAEPGKGPALVSLKTDPNAIEELKAQGILPDLDNKKPVSTRYITVTAYSSDVWQTDDTPFNTANGKYVYDGLVAANFLKFGTQVKFPEYFGDKVFTVDDRMNARYYYRADIWFPTREQAREFGVKYLKVEIY